MGGAVKTTFSPIVSIAQDLGIIKTVSSSTPAPTPVPTPTTAVVSQSSATDAAATTLKNMRRGRSPAILTSGTGETLGNPATTINKPTLLGQ
jgi:hypothetical protein